MKKEKLDAGSREPEAESQIGAILCKQPHPQERWFYFRTLLPPSFRLLASVLMMSFLFFGLTSAKRTSRSQQQQVYRVPQMTSIHLVDRNGFTETISSKERLKQFQQTDFLKSQPYQKVLRIYNRGPSGNACSIITSYHPNGNIKQYLDVMNARAHGTYGEWHENGLPSILTTVIGGMADITGEAEKSWIFDGVSYVWNDKGDLIAEIQYCQGALEGMSSYYHPSGRVWKLVPFKEGKNHGEERIYLDSGDIFQQTNYVQGLKHGSAVKYWSNRQIASQEEYRQGRLECGQYYNSCGDLIAEVSNGYGYRATFGKDSISEIQEYKRGVLEGEVKVFNKDKRLVRTYHSKNDLNHGEEIDYYDTPSQQPLPRLSVQWYQGKVQGTMKSWYSDGTLESQREMTNNAKNGVLTTWYQDGSLMIIEEYDQDKLIRGDYFRKGERSPISQVQEGKGIAMIYDGAGVFVQKIVYDRGKPTEQK